MRNDASEVIDGTEDTLHRRLQETKLRKRHPKIVWLKRDDKVEKSSCAALEERNNMFDKQRWFMFPPLYFSQLLQLCNEIGEFLKSFDNPIFGIENQYFRTSVDVLCNSIDMGQLIRIMTFLTSPVGDVS